ncbi:MAG: SsrA-binding protein SmpB [Sedimentisphaerales bacterium]|nr:SsrA-binding protein SmpB [Sedimentisphaerales bacterium]
MSKKTKKSEKTADKPYSPKIVNKKARFNYNFLEKLEAGIALVGTEVKSLRQGKASLDEAFARISGGELFLVNCMIPIYEQGNLANHEPTRVRKLLVHKRELDRIKTKLTQKGLTLIPTRIYFSRGLAKVEITLAEGKSFGDKRGKIKDREMTRDVQRATRRYDR